MNSVKEARKLRTKSVSAAKRWEKQLNLLQNMF